MPSNKKQCREANHTMLLDMHNVKPTNWTMLLSHQSLLQLLKQEETFFVSFHHWRRRNSCFSKIQRYSIYLLVFIIHVTLFKSILCFNSSYISFFNISFIKIALLSNLIEGTSMCYTINKHKSFIRSDTLIRCLLFCLLQLCFLIYNKQFYNG